MPWVMSNEERLRHHMGTIIHCHSALRRRMTKINFRNGFVIPTIYAELV